MFLKYYLFQQTLYFSKSLICIFRQRNNVVKEKNLSTRLLPRSTNHRIQFFKKLDKYLDFAREQKKIWDIKEIVIINTAVLL